VTASDLALVIGASTGGVVALTSCFGGLYLQLKTLSISQASAKMIDVNTTITAEAKAASVDAAAAAAQTSKGLTGVIVRVEEAKTLSANNATVIASVASKVSDVIDKIDTVAESASQSVDRVAAAKLAQGLAEGHVQGVAAEQARVAGMTQQFKALAETREGG